MADVADPIKPHMLCHRCGVQKIGRLELIRCNECAAKKESPDGS